MFRDLKEYQEIAKIYTDKVSKPEDLEERVRGGGMQSRIKPFEKPAPNASNRRAEMSIKKRTPSNTDASGKVIPTTAEIRAKNPNAVGGGNAGASTDSGGTSQSTIKSVKQKPEVKTPVKKMGRIEKQNRARLGDARVDALKKKNAEFQAAKKSGNLAQFRKDNPKMSGADRAKAMAKARLAKKAAMEEYTPYDFVLEYLLSTEQVATIEEANYVMTEMDAETIQGIVESQKKNLEEGLPLLAKGAMMVGGAVLAKKGLDKAKKGFDNYINKQRDKGIGGNTRPGSDKIYYGK